MYILLHFSGQAWKTKGSFSAFECMDELSVIRVHRSHYFLANALLIKGQEVFISVQHVLTESLYLLSKASQ